MFKLVLFMIYIEIFFIDLGSEAWTLVKITVIVITQIFILNQTPTLMEFSSFLIMWLILCCNSDLNSHVHNSIAPLFLFVCVCDLMNNFDKLAQVISVKFKFCILNRPYVNGKPRIDSKY